MFLENYNLKMKNIYFFFFIFIIVLNIPDTEQIKYTKNTIDKIVKNIQEISNSKYCVKNTLNNKLDKFGLTQYKTKRLASQINNACKSSTTKDKKSITRVFYAFFQDDIKIAKTYLDDGNDGVIQYLCIKIWGSIGYNVADCYKK